MAGAVGKTKYLPDYARQAENLCKLGATDIDLANFFEVSKSTVNLWKLEHREFMEALIVGKEPADNRVKMSLYNRACGYSHEEEDVKVCDKTVVVTKITKHYPPDTVACFFWLKNRLPLEFRDNPADGGGADDMASVLRDLIAKLPN